MNGDEVARWIGSYERAWRTPGTAALAGIFSQDATYLQGPYDDPVIGLPAISRMWEAEREGPDEVFALTSEVIAVDDRTAVVRAQVRYGEPVHQEYRDLWIIGFADDGLCAHFEEWPFWPPKVLAEVGDEVREQSGELGGLLQVRGVAGAGDQPHAAAPQCRDR